MGMPVLSTDGLPEHFGVFLDPDTGVPLPTSASRTATPSHASLSFIVDEFDRLHPAYMICFDQSAGLTRAQQRDSKRAALPLSSLATRNRLNARGSERLVGHLADQATHRRVYERAGPTAFEDYWKAHPLCRGGGLRCKCNEIDNYDKVPVVPKDQRRVRETLFAFPKRSRAVISDRLATVSEAS